MSSVLSSLRHGDKDQSGGCEKEVRRQRKPEGDQVGEVTDVGSEEDSMLCFSIGYIPPSPPCWWMGHGPNYEVKVGVEYIFHFFLMCIQVLVHSGSDGRILFLDI